MKQIKLDNRNKKSHAQSTSVLPDVSHSKSSKDVNEKPSRIFVIK